MNDPLYTRLQAEYKQSIPHKLALLTHTLHALHQAITQEQLQELRMLVHKMAGSAGTFGYPEASTLCSACDQRLQALLEQYPACQESLDWLRELDHFLKQLYKSFDLHEP